MEREIGEILGRRDGIDADHGAIILSSWRKPLDDLCRNFSGIAISSEDVNSRSLYGEFPKASFILSVESEFAPRKFLLFGPRIFRIAVDCGKDVSHRFQSYIMDEHPGDGEKVAWHACGNESDMARMVMETIKEAVGIMSEGGCLKRYGKRFPGIIRPDLT